jgi:3'(2'), 5'-bisphosphate nucleotidase
MNTPLQPWLTQLLPLVARAGDAVMAVYNTDFRVAQKADASPVTEADVMAEAIITDGLRSLTPDIPVIGEEATASGSQAAAADTFWLIDPVDGTREFLDRNGEFTVNIALIHRGKPCLGIVAAPALGEVFWGLNTPLERAAYWQATPQTNPERIMCTQPPAAGLRVLRSRNHGDSEALDAFLTDFLVSEALAVGSSLKFCRMAQGLADLYPRFGPTMAWDTAAAHAVLAAAGGRICTLSGEDLFYDPLRLKNPNFIAWGQLEPSARR